MTGLIALANRHRVVTASVLVSLVTLPTMSGFAWEASIVIGVLFYSSIAVATDGWARLSLIGREIAGEGLNFRRFSDVAYGLLQLAMFVFAILICISIVGRFVGLPSLEILKI